MGVQPWLDHLFDFKSLRDDIPRFCLGILYVITLGGDLLKDLVLPIMKVAFIVVQA